MKIFRNEHKEMSNLMKPSRLFPGFILLGFLVGFNFSAMAGNGKTFADVTISVPTTFAAADASDGTVDGIFTVNGNLTIAAGGSILNDGNVNPAMIFQVSGNVTLAGGSPGGQIISLNTAGGGGNHFGGNITIIAGGDINTADGSEISTTGKSGGAIVIEANGPNSKIDIDGLVRSEGTITGVGINQPPGGGPITIKATTTVTISDTGIVSSIGKDPGADLVHICGCDVIIYGLVESTGPGHVVPSNPLNHLNSSYRPDKDPQSTAGVEIWAANSLIIDRLNHNGEVKADLCCGGGSQGESWIDLFCKGTITILGTNDPYNNDLGHNTNPPGWSNFAVHANGNSGNTDNGGTITIKSLNGIITASGLAVQADGPEFGGLVTIEAKNAVTLDGASIYARGDVNYNGGNGNGGKIYIRSFQNTISWQNGVGDVRPYGGVTPIAKWGEITFQKCFVPPVNTSGTLFPMTGGGNFVPTTLPDACGGSPLLPLQVTPDDDLSYVEFCGCVTDPSSCLWCSKASCLNQVFENMDNACVVPDILVDVRMLHGGANDVVDISEIGTGIPATWSMQAAIDYVNLHGDPTPGDGQIFIGVTATDPEPIDPTICGFSCARPPSGDSPWGTENVIINNMNPERLNVYGCSVTMKAAIGGQPVITIQNSVGKVTVLDLHVKNGNDCNSKAGIGYLIQNNADLVVVKNSSAWYNDIGYDVKDDNVQITGAQHINCNRIGVWLEGNNNILRTNSDIIFNTEAGIRISGNNNETNNNEVGNSGHPNAVGIIVTGNNNDLHDDNVEYNSGNGINVSGNGNTVEEEDLDNNGGKGISVTGNNNQILKNKQTKFNGEDGIYVSGTGNQLTENVTSNNGGHGINADQANGASLNKLSKNQANKNSKQGIRACGQIDLGNNVGEDNLLDPQVAFTCGTNPKFLVVDISKDKAYKYDASFNLVSSSVLTSNNSDANDVAVNGTNTYVLDKADKQVYRYVGSTTASKVLKDMSGNGLSTLTGIAISGNDMWVVDDSKKKMYKYSLSAAFAGSGNINALQEILFTGNNADAEGLAIDANYLYVLDDNDKQFYRYSRAGGAGIASKVMKETGGGNIGTPVGAVIDGLWIWIVDNNKDKAYQYSLSSLFTGSGSLNASLQYPLYGLNADATGIAIGNSSNFIAKGVTEIAEIDQPKEYPSLLVFPNPAKDNTTIQFTSMVSGRYTLMLIDETGRVVMTGVMHANKGINYYELALDKYAKGMYLLVLKNDKEKLQKRILVE
jgi:hypothetical protein